MLPFRPGAAWQTLLLLCVIAFCTNYVESNEGRVVCYYTNWSVYRPGTAKFNPQNINPYLCTHLIYAFGGFTKDNQMKPFDKYQDIEQGGYAKFTGLKTYNKQLKTMIAIGGWNEASSRFSPLVASNERRQQFIKNILKFLRQNHFDGIDLDWEYPAHREGGKSRDRDNYAQFVQELRAEFEREAEKTGRTRLLLTMAVPAGIEYIDKGYDIPKLNKYLDWFNLLTYDFHSSHEPSVNHHAPLYSLEDDSEYNYDAELNIDYSIKYYLKAGADHDKLVLGIPTYGRSYTLINEESTELGSPSEGPGEQGDATREKGYLAYYEICQSLKEDPEWTVVQPNANVMGPYAYRRNQWVGYDDEAIVRKKAEYVVAHGLGGIMFWAIDNDDFRGTCSGKPYPLIEAAKEAMIEALGLGINEVAKSSGPQKPSRSRSRENANNRNGLTPKPEVRRPAATRRPAISTTTIATPSTTIKLTKAEGSSLYVGGRGSTTPAPPTTPDPGSDFKCEEEGFFQHPRDCKKYYWCLDSGPSGLGIVAHQFTCPSGLYFNPAADSCDFARNVPCKTKKSTTVAPITTSAPTTARTTSSYNRVTAAPPARPIYPRVTTSTPGTTTTTTTSTTAAPEEVEYEEDKDDEQSLSKFSEAEEDPQVIKELIDLIRKVGGVEQLEKHLLQNKDGSITLKENSASGVATTPSTISKSLYDRVLSRPGTLNSFTRNRLNAASLQVKSETTESTNVADNSSQNNYSKYSSVLRGNSRQGPQNEGIEKIAEFNGFSKERKQYVTINRNRGAQATAANSENETDDEDYYTESNLAQVDTTKRPLSAVTPSYTSLRRSRPSTTTPLPNESDEEVEQPVAVKEQTQTKHYATLNRNRGRGTTERSDTTASVGAGVSVSSTTNRYKYFERTRPTTSSGSVKEAVDGTEEEADTDEDEEEYEDDGQQQKNVKFQRNQGTQTTTTTTITNSRKYASIGRRTTTTTATTTTTTTIPETSTTTYNTVNGIETANNNNNNNNINSNSNNVKTTPAPEKTRTSHTNESTQKPIESTIITLTTESDTNPESTTTTSPTTTPTTTTTPTPTPTPAPTIIVSTIQTPTTVFDSLSLSEDINDMLTTLSPINESIDQSNPITINNQAQQNETTTTTTKTKTESERNNIDSNDNVDDNDDDDDNVDSKVTRTKTQYKYNTITNRRRLNTDNNNNNNNNNNKISAEVVNDKKGLSSVSPSVNSIRNNNSGRRQPQRTQQQQQQQQEELDVTATTTELPIISSPRPFGYPRLRTRPTKKTTITVNDNNNDNANDNDNDNKTHADDVVTNIAKTRLSQVDRPKNRYQLSRTRGTTTTTTTTTAATPTTRRSFFGSRTRTQVTKLSLVDDDQSSKETEESDEEQDEEEQEEEEEAAIQTTTVATVTTEKPTLKRIRVIKYRRPLQSIDNNNNNQTTVLETTLLPNNNTPTNSTDNTVDTRKRFRKIVRKLRPVDTTTKSPESITEDQQNLSGDTTSTTRKPFQPSRARFESTAAAQTEHEKEVKIEDDLNVKVNVLQTLRNRLKEQQAHEDPIDGVLSSKLHSINNKITEEDNAEHHHEQQSELQRLRDKVKAEQARGNGDQGVINERLKKLLVEKNSSTGATSTSGSRTSVSDTTIEESSSGSSGASPRPFFRRKLVAKRPYNPSSGSLTTKPPLNLSSTRPTAKFVRRKNGRFDPFNSNVRNRGEGFVRSDPREPRLQNTNNFNKQQQNQEETDEDYEEEIEEQQEQPQTHLNARPGTVLDTTVRRPFVPLKKKPTPEVEEEEESEEESDEEGDEEEEEDEQEVKDKHTSQEADIEQSRPAYRSKENRVLPGSRPNFAPTAGGASNTSNGNIPFNPRKNNNSPSSSTPANRFGTSNRPRVVNRPPGVSTSNLTLRPVANNYERTTPLTPLKPAPFIPSNTRSYERKYTGPSTETPEIASENSLIEDLNIDALNARNKKIFDIHSKKHTTLKPKVVATYSKVESTGGELETESEQGYVTTTPSTPLPTTTTTSITQSTDTINTDNGSGTATDTYTDNDNGANEATKISSLPQGSTTLSPPPATTLLHVFTLHEGATDEDLQLVPTGRPFGSKITATEPKHKLIEINRIVEINSKQAKQAQRKSKANNQDFGTVRVESLPHVEQLGEISVVKYVHLVDGSHIQINDGHSTVADYTPTEPIIPKNSPPVRNSLPETDENDGPIVDVERDGKSLLPEVIRGIETSTISLEGLFDSSRKAKQLDIGVETNTERIVEQDTIAPPPVGVPGTETALPVTYVRPILPLLRPESNESSPLIISIANLDKVILSKVPASEDEDDTQDTTLSPLSTTTTTKLSDSNSEFSVRHLSVLQAPSTTTDNKHNIDKSTVASDESHKNIETGAILNNVLIKHNTDNSLTSSTKNAAASDESHRNMQIGAILNNVLIKHNTDNSITKSTTKNTAASDESHRNIQTGTILNTVNTNNPTISAKNVAASDESTTHTTTTLNNNNNNSSSTSEIITYSTETHVVRRKKARNGRNRKLRQRHRKTNTTTTTTSDIPTTTTTSSITTVVPNI